MPGNYQSAWELSECPGIIRVPGNYLSVWELSECPGIIRVPGNYWSACLIDFQFSAPWQWLIPVSLHCPVSAVSLPEPGQQSSLGFPLEQPWERSAGLRLHSLPRLTGAQRALLLLCRPSLAIPRDPAVLNLAEAIETPQLIDI